MVQTLKQIAGIVGNDKEIGALVSAVQMYSTPRVGDWAVGARLFALALAEDEAARLGCHVVESAGCLIVCAGPAARVDAPTMPIRYMKL